MRGGWRHTWQGGGGEECKEKKDGLNAIATQTMILATTPTCLPG